MQQIIQGNDTTVSVILHQQSIHLSGTADDTQVESAKINLTQVKEISVRLIPYMRWEEVSPSFSVRDNVLEVAFPATQQRQGKWDIEISFLMPSVDGGYKQARVKQAFAEVLPTNYPTSTLSAYVVSAEVTTAMRGETGLDAYQTALARGLVGSVDEWIEYIRGPRGFKGDKGEDAYEAYLKTTKDNPPLPKEQWANLNDFLLQLLFRIIKGREAQLMANDMTADLILELDRQRREMAKALQSYGAEVKDTDGLDTFADVIRQLVDPIILYKDDQFYLSPNVRLPKMLLREDWDKPRLFCTFQKAVHLKTVPEIVGVERTTTIDRMCNGASALMGEVSLPDLPVCEYAGGVFYGCSNLHRVILGNMLECTSLINLCRDCRSLTYARIGNVPKCTSIQNLFENCEKLEEVYLGDLGKPTEGAYVFNNCKRLRRVLGVPLDISNLVLVSSFFENCEALEEVRIKGAKQSLWIHQSPKLSVDSVRYLIDNAHNVDGATINLSKRLFDEHRNEMEAIGQRATAKGFTITYR